MRSSLSKENRRKITQQKHQRTSQAQNFIKDERMGKTYQEIVADLVDRIYKRETQHTSRVILKTYFCQPPGKNTITLEKLGQLKELASPVTRERSRQIIEKFISTDLPKEYSRLTRGIAHNDQLTLEKKRDVLTLRNILDEIIKEAKKFERPIFAYHIQESLIKNALLMIRYSFQ